jgi:hypothetical protein
MLGNKQKYIFVFSSIMMNNITFASFAYSQYIFLPILATIFFQKNLILDKIFFKILFLVSFVLIGQAIVFQTFSLYNFGGPYIIFLTPYFVYRLVGRDYFKMYVDIIHVMAIISLIFWSLQNISDGFTQLLVSISSKFNLDPASNESVLIYNLEHSRSSLGFIKNSGYTAEGGLYSSFLIVALFLNYFFSPNIFNRKNAVFIITLITTSSTAGYSALGVFLLMVILTHKSKVLRFVLFPIISYLIYFSIYTLPFMYEKIQKSYEDEMNVYRMENNPARKGRFLSARIDLDLIVKYPLTGKGIYASERFLNEEEKEIGYSNSYLGLVGLASRYGLVFWLFYFYYFFYFCLNLNKIAPNVFKNTGKNRGLFFIGSIVCIALGQNPFYSFVYVIIMVCGHDVNIRKLIVR